VTTRLATVLALTLTLAAVVIAGCSAPAQTTPPGAQSSAIEQTSGAAGADATATTGEAADPGSASGSKADVGSIDEQLKAMQSEIDGMKMPSDTDFNGAAGAVY